MKFLTRPRPGAIPRVFRLLPLAALLAHASPAQTQTVSFRVLPPAEKPRLAEPFRLRVELTCPGDYEVSPDTASFRNEVFALMSVKKASSRTDGGLKTEVFDLRSAAFDTGVSTFPETTWRLKKDGELKEAVSPSFELEVLPLFDEKSEAGDIRDIRPPFSFFPWPWLLAALLAAALAGWLIYRRRAAREAAPETAPPDTRSPYQKASEALEALAAAGLWEKGQVKEFYSALTGILRTYLDDEFAIKAEFMTTGRLTRELRTTGADIRAVVRTRELLERSDLAKFARFRPDDAARDADIASLRDLLLSYAQRADEKKALAAAERAAGGAA